jgi:preprotein translocase subunit SecD
MRRGLVWSLVGIIVLAAVALTATLAAGHSILLGLDLRGGVSVVLQPQGTATNSELQEAVNIIENRVNGLGVGNSSVSRQGHDVVINLPGIKDSSQALQVLGQTATLYFRPVLCIIPTNPTETSPTTTVPKTSPTTKAALNGHIPNATLTAVHLPAASSTSATTTPANTGTGSGLTEAEAQSACSVTSSTAANLPTTQISADTSNSYVILPYYDHSARYVLGPADMKGDVVSNTSVIAPTAGGGYQVQVTFTSKGAEQFDNIAAQRYPNYASDPSNPPYSSMEAIELDWVVQSAPTIQASSFHGTAVISGSSSAPFSSKQASDLALVLKYGSLPVRFVPQSVQTVSATIGKDSLRAGLLAGIGGIIVVMIYMLLYYRALALVVLVGLGIGGALLYAILAQLSQSSNLTLTLAGVTGIIVSIGITVDSYIVFFERLKDEVRAGRTVRQSVERSFSRAFRTVLTADLVSFLAALILYLFTVGDVRGFAFTLGLSTLLDVFVAWFFIRPAVILIGRRRGFVDNPVFGINRGLGGRVDRTGDGHHPTLAETREA